MCHMMFSYDLQVMCNTFSFDLQVMCNMFWGLSWSCSYGSLIYNYLCNQCLSPLRLWVRTTLRRGILDTTLCDKVCQRLATGRWFSPVSTTNTDHHDITEILLKLKVELNTINQPIDASWKGYLKVINFSRTFELNLHLII